LCVPRRLSVEHGPAKDTESFREPRCSMSAFADDSKENNNEDDNDDDADHYDRDDS